MEIIEGMIERGGSAERHSHRDHEQLLYVLEGVGVPLLIHYSKGAPHGTGGGIAEPLELLVIHSPPNRRVAQHAGLIWTSCTSSYCASPTSTPSGPRLRVRAR